MTSLLRSARPGCWAPRARGVQRRGPVATGYCRVSEVFAQIDPTLSVIMGVHQSIGMKPIALYGSDEQKGRFLPDLAAGRKLAAFALTEPNAGSDVNGIETTATRQADGSWILNGEKRYIGNGSKASVLSTFARIEDTDEFIALILGEGDEGLRGRPPLRHDGPARERPPPPPLQRRADPGRERDRRAGRRLQDRHAHAEQRAHAIPGTGSVGGTKILLDRVIDHVKERRQFGMPLAEFELVQDKIGWMVSYLFGLEAMAYMTTGLVDAGVPDYSLESAIVKVSATEFLWYGTNRALQLKGGAGYARRAVREGAARRASSRSSRAPTTSCAFIALSG